MPQVRPKCKSGSKFTHFPTFTKFPWMPQSDPKCPKNPPWAQEQKKWLKATLMTKQKGTLTIIIQPKTSNFGYFMKVSLHFNFASLRSTFLSLHFNLLRFKKGHFTHPCIKPYSEPQFKQILLKLLVTVTHLSTGMSTQKLRSLKYLNKFFHLWPRYNYP